MTAALRVIGLSLVAGQLAACGTIHKPFEIDGNPPKSLSIDARQRVVLVTDHGGKNHTEHVVCAEPSPDVFVAAAASGSLSVDVGQRKGESAGQVSEAAASLSRGITIQLLRDGLYRACEAYMNGALDWEEYRDLLTFYDVTMITTLAIEGVTQLKPPAPVSINSPGLQQQANQTAPNTPGQDAAGKTPAQDLPDTASAASAQATEMLKAYYETKVKLVELVHQAKIGSHPAMQKQNP